MAVGNKLSTTKMSAVGLVISTPSSTALSNAAKSAAKATGDSYGKGESMQHDNQQFKRRDPFQQMTSN